MDLWYQIRRVAHLTPVQIDGWVFRLHYWVTSTGILAASAVAFAKQYFGDPIECIFVSIYSIIHVMFDVIVFLNIASTSIMSPWLSIHFVKILMSIEILIQN